MRTSGRVSGSGAGREDKKSLPQREKNIGIGKASPKGGSFQTSENGKKTETRSLS